jgi:hypothetical protein
MRMKILSVDRSAGADSDRYERVINPNTGEVLRFCKKDVLQALQQKRWPR